MVAKPGLSPRLIFVSFRQSLTKNAVFEKIKSYLFLFLTLPVNEKKPAYCAGFQLFNLKVVALVFRSYSFRTLFEQNLTTQSILASFLVYLDKLDFDDLSLFQNTFHAGKAVVGDLRNME